MNTPAPPARHRLHPAYSHPVLQEYHNQTPVTAASLVYPIFVTADPDAKEPIASLPNQYRWGRNRLDELIAPLVKQGLRSVLIFGVLTENQKKLKDGLASFATHPDNPVAACLHHLRKHYPKLLLMTDVCLCAYTDHGHCGIVNASGVIENQPSIHRLAEVAVFYAQNGAHVVAPSDMMDGRIAAIKAMLREKGLEENVAVLSYAAKFASCLYGPFRDAACSGMAFGDRTLYQLPPASRNLALRAIERDVAEGADMVMVKPGGFYLDILRDCKEIAKVPIAVYQVSGEYAMLYHAAAAGAFKLRAVVMESLTAMRRAGADILLTYFAPEVLGWLAQDQLPVDNNAAASSSASS